MDKNIEKLINKIQLDEEYHHYFNNSLLKRIIANKEKTLYTFIIEIQNTFPVDVYQLFIDKLKNAYQDVSSVLVAFSVINKDTIDFN